MGPPTESDTHRKLTTILTADVQSYAHLMEADEEGTLATLKAYRAAASRLIESHDGRVINTWGDGLFAEFPSVVEATRAAVDIQNDLAQRNAGRPSETRMHFRIGINLGDVIADGDDLYGDGVNVAARLQATAPAGGIVISRTVYEHVRDKVPVGFEFLGDLKVKNIDHGIPSYAVLVGEGARAPHRGHEPADAAIDVADRVEGRRRLRSRLVKLGVVAVFFVAVNLASDAQDFWAQWPLLIIAVLAGASWAKTLPRTARRRAYLLIAAAGAIGANALSWSGKPWSVWLVLILGLILALDWARHLGHRRS